MHYVYLEVLISLTKIQKIIKYFAISLAIVLIVSIFSFSVSIISNIFGFKMNNKIDEVVIKEINSDILEIDIEIEDAKLTFKTDNVFKVEANEKIKINVKNKKLIIKENISLFNDNLEEIIIYLPNTKKFNNVSIEAGSSNIKIDNLITDILDLELGAGRFESNLLSVSNNARIDTGAGMVNIMKTLINNLDLDMGIGEVKINGTLTGVSDIDAGIGKLEINLNEFINNYNFRVEKGIGDIYINGDVVSNHYNFGVGGNKIIVDGGIGSISINTLK